MDLGSLRHDLVPDPATSRGMFAAITAGAQGTLAWYATYVTGNAAESWFAKGKFWGETGPKETIKVILDSLDRESILLSARSVIMNRLNRTGVLEK